MRVSAALAVAAAGLLLTVRFSSANSGPVISSAQRIAKFERVTALIPEAKEHGQLRIIVQLNVPSISGGALANAFQAYSHRSAIADAQRKLGGQLTSLQSEVVRNFKNLPLSVLNVTLADLKALANNPLIVSVQEDVPDPLVLDGSIPLIGADDAWTSGFTGSGQHVAILDTGVDSSHEFLIGKVVAEACFSTTDAGSSSSTLCPGGAESETGAGAAVNCSLAITGGDHGTHVAGIAAGTGASFSGVAKGADIIAVQVFSRFDDEGVCGAGNSPCILSWTSDQIAGLDWVYSQSGTYATASANMSLGGGTYSANCDTDMRKTYVDQLRSAGIATVISSGNNGYTSRDGSPCVYFERDQCGIDNLVRHGVVLLEYRLIHFAVGARLFNLFFCSRGRVLIQERHFHGGPSCYRRMGGVEIEGSRGFGRRNFIGAHQYRRVHK